MRFSAIALACSLASGVVLTGCADQAETANVKELARPAPFQQIDLLEHKLYSFAGEVKASEQAYLSFRVPGQIEKLHVQAGQRVKSGDLLAELDPEEYEAQVAAQQARYALAKVQHQRSIALIDDHLISQERFDQTFTEQQVAENELKVAKTNLSYTNIYAPYDGIIGARYVENYEYAQALLPILSVQTENSLDVQVEVPERLISAIRRSKGKSLAAPQVSFSVKPDVKYAAVFKEITTASDPETGSFSVTLTLPQPEDLTLYPGMGAEAHVPLVLDDLALIQHIPQSAVFTEQAQNYVWVVGEDSRVAKRAVELTDDYHLVSGLEDGENIVAAGAKELVAGQLVKAWIKERGL